MSDLDDAIRILVASLRDPEQVVLNPKRARENADGTLTGDYLAPRGCLIVLAGRAAREADCAHEDVRDRVRRMMGRSDLVHAFAVLGSAGCADRIEAA